MNRFQITQSIVSLMFVIMSIRKSKRAITTNDLLEESLQHKQSRAETTLCEVHSHSKHAPIDPKYMVMLENVFNFIYFPTRK